MIFKAIEYLDNIIDWLEKLRLKLIVKMLAKVENDLYNETAEVKELQSKMEKLYDLRGDTEDVGI